jgi:hypothetical protein
MAGWTGEQWKGGCDYGMMYDDTREIYLLYSTYYLLIISLTFIVIVLQQHDMVSACCEHGSDGYRVTRVCYGCYFIIRRSYERSYV